MKRILTTALFLVRDLFASLAGLVVPALSLTFYAIAFQYGMDQPQFITVAGVALGALALLTVLLLAARANRASFYPFVARLHRRAELLLAIGAGSLLITGVVAVLMAAAALAQNKLTLDWPSALWIVPTWLSLWAMAAALGLLLTPLTGRDGSHLLGYLLLTVLLVAHDRRWLLDQMRVQWAGRALSAVLWPPATLLAQASANLHTRPYYLAAGLTLAYALLLLAVAAQLFARKDLIWAE